MAGGERSHKGNEAPCIEVSQRKVCSPIFEELVSAAPEESTQPPPVSNDSMTLLPSNWQYEIITYFKNPQSDGMKLKAKALRFNQIGHDLYKQAVKDVLLLYLGPTKAKKVMAEVHEGICKAHRTGQNMRWTIHQYRYYWPTIYKDCIKYAQGCEAC